MRNLFYGRITGPVTSAITGIREWAFGSVPVKRSLHIGIFLIFVNISSNKIKLYK